MERLIDKLKTKPFSGGDIVEAVDGNTKIVRYPEIHKYNTIDELLHPHNCCVILYESKPRYGHWICILKQPNNTLEFFDPYGMGIDEQLKFIPKHFRQQTKQKYPLLIRMFLNSPYNIVINHMKIQKFNKDVSSCGRHCAMRLISRDLPLRNYQQLMKKEDGLDADDKVTYLTAFIN
jgi:hypothetical protein